MPTAKLLLSVAIFFLTSVISVVTGSTSLITVPVMIALGIEAHVAVATNMLALTFMNVGGSLPFQSQAVSFCPELHIGRWLNAGRFFEDIQESSRAIDSVALRIAYTLHDTRTFQSFDGCNA